MCRVFESRLRKSGVADLPDRETVMEGFKVRRLYQGDVMIAASVKGKVYQVVVRSEAEYQDRLMS